LGFYGVKVNLMKKPPSFMTTCKKQVKLKLLVMIRISSPI